MTVIQWECKITPIAVAHIKWHSDEHFSDFLLAKWRQKSTPIDLKKITLLSPYAYMLKLILFKEFAVYRCRGCRGVWQSPMSVLSACRWRSDERQWTDLDWYWAASGVLGTTQRTGALRVQRVWPAMCPSRRPAAATATPQLVLRARGVHLHAPVDRRSRRRRRLRAGDRLPQSLRVLPHGNT